MSGDGKHLLLFEDDEKFVSELAQTKLEAIKNLSKYKIYKIGRGIFINSFAKSPAASNIEGCERFGMNFPLKSNIDSRSKDGFTYSS